MKRVGDRSNFDSWPMLNACAAPGPTILLNQKRSKGFIERSCSVTVGSHDTVNSFGRKTYDSPRLFLFPYVCGCEGFSLRISVSYELGICKAAPPTRRWNLCLKMTTVRYEPWSLWWGKSRMHTGEEWSQIHQRSRSLYKTWQAFSFIPIRFHRNVRDFSTLWHALLRWVVAFSVSCPLFGHVLTLCIFLPMFRLQTFKGVAETSNFEYGPDWLAHDRTAGRKMNSWV